MRARLFGYKKKRCWLGWISVRGSNLGQQKIRLLSATRLSRAKIEQHVGLMKGRGGGRKEGFGSDLLELKGG